MPKYDNLGREELAITNNVTALDYRLEVSKGNIAGHTAVNKFGRNIDVDTSQEDVWDAGATWVAPTTARTHDIASTSANDDGDPAGTGARTIRIYGLTDWDTAEVSEDVTMNGTSNVATANQYVIIHRMKVLTSGASGPNVGVITATAQTDATVTAHIRAGVGQTQMAVYGVPSTQTAYVTGYYASGNKGGPSSGAVNVRLLYNPVPDSQTAVFLVKHTQAINYTGISYLQHTFSPPNKLAGPGIIKMAANGSATNNDVSAGFDLILVDN